MPRTFSGPLLALALLLGFTPAPSRGERDSHAVEIAERLMAAMGGRDVFDHVRLLQFDWAVVRDGTTEALYHHWWDRQTGRYRVEGTDRDGSSMRAVFPLSHPADGTVWTEDGELSHEAAAELLDFAHGRFINDTYWLLMPWKWLDPGVHLAYEGTNELDGESHDVVLLTFENGTGRTSNDRYWGWVSQRTGLMTRWQYVLQDDSGSAGTGDRTTWDWTGWTEKSDGLKLSTVKHRLGPGPTVEITFPTVTLTSQVTEEALDEIFSPTSPVGSVAAGSTPDSWKARPSR